MTKKEAVNVLKALEKGLKETGKDEPLKDVLIPIFKEALQMGIEELEKNA